jgi:polyisoprenoid-binding protein YceI
MHSILRSAACLSLALGVGVAGEALAAQPTKAAPAPAAKAGAAAPAWTVDKAASRIRFKSAFSGQAFEGGFSRWDAQINFDPRNLAGSKAVVTIDLASANTGDKDRDETIPTGDWFNVSKFPRATFTTTAIRSLGGDRYQATGTLNLKGVARPVTLPFTLAITGDQARMNGQVVLKRNDFGVGAGQFSGADTVPFEVTVVVAVAARRAK